MPIFSYKKYTQSMKPCSVQLDHGFFFFFVPARITRIPSMSYVPESCHTKQIGKQEQEKVPSILLARNHMGLLTKWT